MYRQILTIAGNIIGMQAQRERPLDFPVVRRQNLIRSQNH